jgi:hypothetical protein
VHRIKTRLDASAGPHSRLALEQAQNDMANCGHSLKHVVHKHKTVVERKKAVQLALRELRNRVIVHWAACADEPSPSVPVQYDAGKCLFILSRTLLMP